MWSCMQVTKCINNDESLKHLDTTPSLAQREIAACCCAAWSWQREGGNMQVNGLGKMTEQGYQLAVRAELVMRVHIKKRSRSA